MNKLFDFGIIVLPFFMTCSNHLHSFSTFSSLCHWRGSYSSWTWLLQLVTHSLNFITVDGAEGGSEGGFDIWEAQCAGRKKQRVSWDGGGGCHHCSDTSKDSSADVSKQDGCQVSLVNYLSNKNRLVFMRHARVRALLCGFYAVVFSQSLNLLWAF